MLPPARHRAKAVMAGVLLAGLVILFPATRADAQDEAICTHPTLSGVRVRADTRLVVHGADRTYPRLTATTDYEIPSAWPGVAALLRRSGDKNYHDALRCFIASWPLDQISQVGEYRQQPPAVVQIKEATPAASGKEATPALIVLRDEVTGDLNSRTAPPFLGPWKVEISSHNLELRLINKGTEDYKKWRPYAFDSIIWTARTQLSGLRFHQLEPTPVSTDGEREALWAPLAADESGVLRISVKLDVPTRIAIASGSGAMDAASHIILALINAFFISRFLSCCSSTGRPS